MPRYAISDIHGCNATFRALLRKINFSKDDELFLLGDFIDRGPDSKGVIDHIIHMQEQGYQVHCLRGNHEQLAIDATPGNDSWRTWLAHGGKETCASFNTYAEWYIPKRYLQWMKALPLYLSTEGYLLVHAGVNTKKPDPLADEVGLLWARRYYDSLDTDWLDGRILVHGHTRHGRAKVEAMTANVDRFPVINIDNGCYSNERGQGNLCVLNLDELQLTFQPRID